jgi:hypothetical protein
MEDPSLLRTKWRVSKLVSWKRISSKLEVDLRARKSAAPIEKLVRKESRIERLDQKVAYSAVSLERKNSLANSHLSTAFTRVPE